QVTGDVAADVRDADRVPMAGGLLDLDWLGEQRAFAFDDVEQSKVVFKRVKAGHIVVVLVLAAPDRSAALIELSLSRLERDFQVEVGVFCCGAEAEVEETIGSLGRRLRQD